MGMLIVAMVGSFAATSYFLQYSGGETGSGETEVTASRSGTSATDLKWAMMSGAYVQMEDPGKGAITVVLPSKKAWFFYPAIKEKIAKGDHIAVELALKGEVGEPVQVSIVRHCSRKIGESSGKLMILGESFKIL
jgi:hypothetical protein